jgi:signal transduction histidine kinase
MPSADDKRFARLTSLACHDLRTPLATVFGFARTLARLELDEPAGRYVEMIEAAAAQLGDLLDELALAARIEANRFEPVLIELDSLDLARSAAEELGNERVRVQGEGAVVRVPEGPTRRGVCQLVRAALRHGGLDEVELRVRGAELELSPLTRTSAPVLLGEELRDLGAAVATALIEALGGSVEAEGERLLVRLPT